MLIKLFIKRIKAAIKAFKNPNSCECVKEVVVHSEYPSLTTINVRFIEKGDHVPDKEYIDSVLGMQIMRELRKHIEIVEKHDIDNNTGRNITGYFCSFNIAKFRGTYN